MPASQYQPVIGLEIHVQLRTTTKLFCGCALESREPNSRTCPVCLGLPGALPVVNDEAVRLSIIAARAFGCRVDECSEMARKSYFYPDLPKGYQISQYDRPVGQGGTIRFVSDGKVREIALTRVHLEEDAGRSVHRSDGAQARTLVDYDRCGTPLLEVVTEPVLRSPREASALLRQLVDELVALKVTDGRMERGNVRCDANVSLRRDAEAVGGRAEIKNLNSLRNLRRSLRFEVARLTAAAKACEPAARETRQFDADTGRTRRSRPKEASGAYRYFPEPDLLPLRARAAWLDAAVPPSRLERAEALSAAAGIGLEAAGALLRDPTTHDWYAGAVNAGVEPETAAAWLLGDLRGLLNEAGLASADAALSAADVACVLDAFQAEELSRRSAREVLRRGLSGDRDVREMILAERAAGVTDGGRVAELVDAVIDEHPEAVAAYHEGRTQAIGFLMGRLMRRGGRGLDPATARSILERRLQR